MRNLIFWLFGLSDCYHCKAIFSGIGHVVDSHDPSGDCLKTLCERCFWGENFDAPRFAGLRPPPPRPSYTKLPDITAIPEQPDPTPYRIGDWKTG